MSSFKCPTCGTENIDTEEGYAQECDCLDESVNEPSTKEIQRIHTLQISPLPYCGRPYALRVPKAGIECYEHRGILLKRLAKAEAKADVLQRTLNYKNLNLKDAEAKLQAVRDLTESRHIGDKLIRATDVLKAIGEQE